MEVGRRVGMEVTEVGGRDQNASIGGVGRDLWMSSSGNGDVRKWHGDRDWNGDTRASISRAGDKDGTEMGRGSATPWQC